MSLFCRVFGLRISSFRIRALSNGFGFTIFGLYLSFMEITLQQAQQQVDHWIKTVGVRYFSELTNLGILMEEVGELSRLMVRRYGEQSLKKNEVAGELADEMADVLWVLLCLANQTGVSLTEALEKNFEKKNTRDAERHRENKKLK